MSFHTALPGSVWLLEVVVLVLVCLLFVYPVVAYSQNVLYRRGVLLLVAALVLLAVGSVAELLVDAHYAGPLVAVFAYVAYAASGVVSVAATWRFAREFVTFERASGVDVETEEFVGGFEDEH
ncbi:hypothetical protein [Halarchaeum sp. P4]|uniref:hypothetical protein n=1 Tax=Halarchaeum sp. P4 TaxID=3421639 RepID=UPI003EB7453B